MGCFTNIIWLVVSTLLKNISQLGLLFPIYRKICSKPPTSQRIMENSSWKYGYCQPADFGCESTNRGGVQHQGRCLCFDIFLDDNDIRNLHQKSLSLKKTKSALAVSISVSEATDICSGWHSFLMESPEKGLVGFWLEIQDGSKNWHP